MEMKEILEVLRSKRRGTYASLTKVKDYGNGLIKETDMTIRLGVNFANLESNKGRVIGQLPWGHWVPGLENYVIEHTDKKGNHNMYLRVTSTNAHISKSRYLLNGQEVDKSVAEEMIGTKKLSSKESEVYNVNFKNIIRLS
jgi:hypothetical protein